VPVHRGRTGSGPIDSDARYVNGSDVPTAVGKVGRVFAGATADVERDTGGDRRGSFDQTLQRRG
jgi:hypothetical protein